MGVPAIAGPLADDLEAPEPDATPTAEEFERAAMNQRQDLVEAERAVEAARYGVSIAVGEYYPSVSVSFNYLLYTSPAVRRGAAHASVDVREAALGQGVRRGHWEGVRPASVTTFDEVSDRRPALGLDFGGQKGRITG